MSTTQAGATLRLNSHTGPKFSLSAWRDGFEVQLELSPDAAAALVDALVPALFDGVETTCYLNAENSFAKVGA